MCLDTLDDEFNKVFLLRPNVTVLHFRVIMFLSVVLELSTVKIEYIFNFNRLQWKIP